MKAKMTRALSVFLMVSLLSVEAFSGTVLAAEDTEQEIQEAEPEEETSPEETVEPEEEEVPEEEIQDAEKESASEEETVEPEIRPYADDGDGTTASTTVEAPTMKSVSLEAGKITVKWNTVSNASKYQVYRRTSGTDSWTSLGTATSDSYTDSKSLSYGTAYTYTVQAVGSGSYDSSAYGDNTISAAYLKAPTSVATAVATNGIKVTWKKVSGASGYGVYRRLSSEDSYTLVGTVGSGTTSYTDKSSLKSGKTYYYRVQAYKGDSSAAKKNPKNGQYWGLAPSGVKTGYLSTPTLKSASVAASGTKISWKKVTGAKGYTVYRKTGKNGTYKQIARTTSTSYKDTSSLKAGNNYYYTVRAYKGSWSTAKKNKFSTAYWSYRDGTGVKSVYLAKVPLKGTKKTSSGVKVTWTKVKKASGYGVYRKVSGGSWELIGTTTKASYTDKSSLKKNKNYAYTVRAYKGSKSSAKKNPSSAAYWGCYNGTGLAYSTYTASAAMDSKAQKYTSSTKYLILVNTKTNKLAIYTGKKGNWARKYYWDCTTGKSSTPTKKGQFTVKSKGKSFGSSTYTCWYYTQWYGNYLFHSVLYQKGSMSNIKDGRLGINASHGCVRLAISNAKWIYNNIPKGTKVVTY